MSILGDISGLMGGGGAMPAEARGNIGNELSGVLQGQGINGISGLVQQFTQSGLGAQAASWVGSGSNMPVTAGHIEQALGPNVIGAIASKFGMDPSQATQMLSQHLPGIVDHMTPNGAPSDGSASGGDAPDDSASDDDSADDDDTNTSR